MDTKYETKGNKSLRVIELFMKALKGESLSIQSLADEYNVSTRSITRDINILKDFLAENRDVTGYAELRYSGSDHCYTLHMDNFFTNKELLAIAKVLIGCRTFSTKELLELISKLKRNTDPSDRPRLEKIIHKEIYHYTETASDCESVIENLWKITEAIEKRKLMTVTYYKMDRKQFKYLLKPVSVMFSEYYFYLIAYVEKREGREGREGKRLLQETEGDSREQNKTYNENSVGKTYGMESEDGSHKKLRYFRVDRITNIVMHRRNFTLPGYLDVDEGLLRKRSMYFWPGPTRHISFEFSGPSVQAVLDKIPTARIVEKLNGRYVIEAEVYGNGIKMFLLSQGAWVKVLSPLSFVEEIKDEIERMRSLYA